MTVQIIQQISVENMLKKWFSFSAILKENGGLSDDNHGIRHLVKVPLSTLDSDDKPKMTLYNCYMVHWKENAILVSDVIIVTMSHVTNICFMILIQMTFLRW